MDSLDLGMESVRVHGPDTFVTPPDAQTASSRNTHMMGNAVLDGAAALRAALAETAQALLETPSQALSVGAGFVWVTEKPDQKLSYADIVLGSGLNKISANAIENAVGVRIRDLPITPEKILRALRQKENTHHEYITDHAAHKLETTPPLNFQ